MWNAIISITNNTDFSIFFLNTFLSEQVLPPYSSESWQIMVSPNTSSFKFSKDGGGNIDLQGGLHIGEDCGVWADRGYMESPSVIMDIDVNGVSSSQELNGGQTIVDDFSMGGTISITFRNKVFTQEFRLG